MPSCVQVAWPPERMGFHGSGWVAVFCFGHPPFAGGRPHTRIGLPTWADLGARHGQMWTSRLDGFGYPTWRDVDFQLGRIWVPSVERCGFPTWTEVGFQLGWIWASNVERCGFPTWAGVGIRHGQMWTSRLDGFGCQVWRGVDSRHGQKWAFNLDGFGWPTWADVDFQLGRIWVPGMERCGLSTWAGVGIQICLQMDGHLPTNRAPKLCVRHGRPLLGFHFVGACARPIMGIHQLPNFGRPRASVVGRIPGRPFWTHMGPLEREAHVTCPRGVQLATLRCVVKIRRPSVPISIKCRFTSVGSNFFLIKICFPDICKNRIGVFHLHRSLSLRRQLMKRWERVLRLHGYAIRSKCSCSYAHYKHKRCHTEWRERVSDTLSTCRVADIKLHNLLIQCLTLPYTLDVYARDKARTRIVPQRG